MMIGIRGADCSHRYRLQLIRHLSFRDHKSAFYKHWCFKLGGFWQRSWI